MVAKKRKLPVWLKKKLPHPNELSHVKGTLDRLELETVCREAHCPNLCECFARGTATFMILGASCTRNCRFCAVNHDAQPLPPAADEPERVAEAVRKLELNHVVITSVTRDDLPDGGSGHFAGTITTIRDTCDSKITVEVLTPDFKGDADSIDRVIHAAPDVFNHNIETVPRLYHSVRPDASYERSLSLLSRVARAGLVAKSGMMLGMGETEEEIIRVMQDLVNAGCQLLTLGQYLAPSDKHYGVREFLAPEVFEKLGAQAYDIGFQDVASAPFVRSSYHAEEMIQSNMEVQ